MPIVKFLKTFTSKSKAKIVFRNYSSFIENKIPYISSYQGFEELQYVDLQLDLQRITACKGSKNYNM